MRGKQCFILVASLAVVLLASSVGVTHSSFVDPESSTGNDFQAWTSNQWVQTTKAEFEAGVLNQVDTSSSPGDVKLAISSNWYNSSWAYRKKITINYTKVGANLTDFPVLVSLASEADLASDAQDDGDDILFTSSNGTNKLSHEIEKFNGGTGELVAWVKVPTLSSSTDTDIYMYYGNSQASNQQNAAGVWDSNYKGVWHLHSNFLDSTSNSNTGTNSGSTNTTGKIANARSFDGVDDYIQVSPSTSINNPFSAGGTISAWIYPTGWGENNFGRIACKSTTTGSGNGWAFHLANGAPATAALGFARGFSTTYGYWYTPANSLSLNTWWHVVVVYNDSLTTNDPLLYINGVSQTLAEYSTPAGTAQTDELNNMRIGNVAFDTIRTFAGKIDEIHISKVVRSSGWIATCYNNQNSPSTFYSVGAEQGSSSLGTIASQVLNTGVTGARWDALFWDETLESGTNITFEVRASNTSFAKDAATPSWTPVTSGLPSGRYKQWRATLTTSDISKTPTLHEVRVYYY